MQVTKLRIGFRISVSDSEFAVLEALARLGRTYLTPFQARSQMTPAQKAALPRFMAGETPLPITTDRRDLPRT